MGFWRFDDNVSPVAFLNNPDSRVIHPSQFLAAHARMDCFTPQVLMPYLRTRILCGYGGKSRHGHGRYRAA